MSMSAQEKIEARNAYGWDTVAMDIAFVSPLTLAEATAFRRAVMEPTGIHPYDLVEWVADYYRRVQVPRMHEAEAIARLVRDAHYEQGSA